MSLLAAQMYTLRDHCKTAVDLAKACERVKKMGYDGVQLSGVVELPGDEMQKILDDTGLKCCVTHISIDAMENSTEAVIERHQKMNCLQHHQFLLMCLLSRRQILPHPFKSPLDEIKFRQFFHLYS